MRTAADLKAKWLSEIPLMLERTSMWAKSGEEADTLFRRLVEDLCFLDERDPAVVIRERQRYGATGIDGALRELLGDGIRTVAEVASVYAELLHQLGYLQVASADWSRIAGAARAGIGDLRRGELEAAYGEPSLVIDGRIGCYASADGWLFVDYCGLGDDLVRDVRVPSQHFRDGVFLTPYGRGIVGGGL
jgi:hypothetical protein